MSKVARPFPPESCELVCALHLEEISTMNGSLDGPAALGLCSHALEDLSRAIAGEMTLVGVGWFGFCPRLQFKAEL